MGTVTLEAIVAGREMFFFDGKTPSSSACIDILVSAHGLEMSKSRREGLGRLKRGKGEEWVYKYILRKDAQLTKRQRALTYGK